MFKTFREFKEEYPEIPSEEVKKLFPKVDIWYPKSPTQWENMCYNLYLESKYRVYVKDYLYNLFNLVDSMLTNVPSLSVDDHIQNIIDLFKINHGTTVYKFNTTFNDAMDIHDTLQFKTFKYCPKIQVCLTMVKCGKPKSEFVIKINNRKENRNDRKI